MKRSGVTLVKEKEILIWPHMLQFEMGHSRVTSRLCYSRRFATKIFRATQRCNIVATLFRIVTTLLQHCNGGLH